MKHGKGFQNKRRKVVKKRESVERNEKLEHYRHENGSPVHDVHCIKQRDANIAEENIESANIIVLRLARDAWPVEL